MLFNQRFLESCNIILGSETVNDDANSDIPGDRINLAHYAGVAVVIIKPAGTAGDDLTVDFDQHTAASSGSSKALNVDNIAFNLGATTLAAASGWVYGKIGTPVDTIDLVNVGGTVVASRNAAFAVGAAIADIVSDTNDAIIVFDIPSSSLDGGGGYNWFSMNSEGDAIGNALVLNVLYIPYGAKLESLAPLTITA